MNALTTIGLLVLVAVIVSALALALASRRIRGVVEPDDPSRPGTDVQGPRAGARGLSG